MFIVSVTVFVKPENIPAFTALILDNARNTRKEPGNLRFDVSQGEDDSGRFLLYEVYKAKDDFLKHQQTAHYFRWRDGVTEMMAQPRQAAKYKPVFHGESEV